MTSEDPGPWLRRARLGALAGGVGWLGLVASPGALTAIDTVEWVVMLALLVVVPLALVCTFAPDADGALRTPWRAAVVLQPLAAVLGCASFLMMPGTVAAGLCLPWLCVVVCLAWLAFERLLVRGLLPLEELAIDAGLAYSVVGGVWLVASRGGVKLLGFEEPWVLLTAMHFHYAGLAAPLVAGLTGRALAARGAALQRTYSVFAAIVVAGPPLVALGITGSPVLEVLSACALAAGMVGMGTLLVFAVSVEAWRALRGAARVAAGLFVVAGASLGLTMAYAALFATSEFTGVARVSIGEMARIHGLLNALGVAVGALIGFALLAPSPRAASQE